MNPEKNKTNENCSDKCKNMIDVYKRQVFEESVSETDTVKINKMSLFINMHY